MHEEIKGLVSNNIFYLSNNTRLDLRDTIPKIIDAFRVNNEIGTINSHKRKTTRAWLIA